MDAKVSVEMLLYDICIIVKYLSRRYLLLQSEETLHTPLS